MFKDSKPQDDPKADLLTGKLKPPPISVPPPQRAPASRPDGRMYVLVICGVDRPKSNADAGIFGDFMGISLAFRNLLNTSLEGTFLSCFPLDQHFEHLGNQGIKDIKFGKFGANNKPLFVFTREKFEQNRDQQWYDYVPPGQLMQEVGLWIRARAQETASGDVVNIFFQCHGSHNGGIEIGDSLVASESIVRLLSLFKPGVQVNAVGSHCYSGHLVELIAARNELGRYAVAAAGKDEKHYGATRSVSNRVRNFRFSQPFIQSLAKIKLPHLQQNPSGPLTVETHDRYMQDALEASIVGSPRSTYTSYLSDEKVAALALVEDLLLRDSVDVDFHLELMHRRRRREWPSMDLTVLNQMTIRREHPDPEVRRRAADLVRAEAADCDFDQPQREDGAILGELELANPNYSMLLQALYWRSRQQSAIWDLFTVLVERGFLDYRVSLEAPISFDRGTDSVALVEQVLVCFDEVKSLMEKRHEGTNPFCEGLEGAIIWLAVMIARGCADPPKLFDTIEATGMLGKFNMETAELFVTGPRPRTIVCDRYAMAGTSKSYFGFWLPHGVGENRNERTLATKIRAALNKFNQVESCYKQYFQLSDDELLLEIQQDPYLRSHPNRQPRFKHSGQWVEGYPASPPLSPTDPSIQSIFSSFLTH
ncbi:hypothetical protein L228DRAFT_284252 [Xylona heveae TC161]|uniref:Uncharacterized protein n=1 Tax=Xylona heveae (strain CBS 132557 / TC161) TaxID=1328760 RepID=A0A165FND9_XYLHT|nr:hypothetical protein L228DRAFT_284252 [Xylona heveae TC161]KZF21188.1 hypothetical protein L228DRAFT_284252 [Xylona heveae TC161]